MSATNASTLVADIVGGNAATMIGGLAAVSASAEQVAQTQTGLLRLSRHLAGTFTALPARLPQQFSTALAAVVTVDEPVSCDSGSMRITGTLSDSGLGTVSVTFSNCRMGTDTASGAVTMRIDAFDIPSSTPTDFTMTLDFLAFTSPAGSVVMGGSLRAQTSLAANSQTLTANFVTRDNATARTTKAENLVFVTVYNNIGMPSSYTQAVTGRVYDHVNGFVAIATQTPFAFGTLEQEFPDSGQMILTGAASANLRIMARSSALAAIGLDLNGDNVFETTAVLKWTDLSTAAGADLGDSDGDGMHNSWETVHALNPIVNDAGNDADSDGATNLAEYQGGSDPRDPLSLPVPAAPLPPAGVVPLDPSLLPLPMAHVTVAGASDLAFDATSGTIFAGARAGLGNPGSVVPIDPVAHTMGTPIAVGSEPVKLAVSDNGQYLYVGLDGAPSVQRVALATGSVDLTIALGTDPILPGADYYVQDMQVLPGSPQSFAASLRFRGFSAGHAGVVVYDNAVARATRTPTFTGSNVIEFGASASTLYGYNNETTEFGFRRMTVDPGGVTVNDVYDSFHVGGGLIEGFGLDIRFSAGRIYVTNGRVIDPATEMLVGTIAIPGLTGLVAADGSLGRVFYLTPESGGNYSLRAFDYLTLAQLGAVNLGNFSTQPTNLIRWGTKGLAFRSGDDIYFVASTALIP